MIARRGLPHAAPTTACLILALVVGALAACDSPTDTTCRGVDEDNPCPRLTQCVPELDRCAAEDTVDASRLTHAPVLAVAPDGAVYLAARDDASGSLLFGVFDEVDARFRLQVVDSDAHVDSAIALATFADGRPAMAYVDSRNDRIKFAVFNEQGVWQTEVVHRDTHAHTLDLAIDTSATPHIAWRDDTSRALRYAHRDSNRVWRPENVDLGIDLPERIPPEEACSLRDPDDEKVGYAPHIAVQGSTPIISYYDADCGTLRLARGSGDGQWTLRVLDGGPTTPGDASSILRRGRYNDVAVNDFGQVVVAYFDAHNGELRAVNLAGDNQLVDDGVRETDEGTLVKHIVGQQPSIAFDPQGRTLVTHLDAATRRMLLSSYDDGAWTTRTLDDAPEGFGSNLVVGPDGTAYIVGLNRTDAARPRVELVRLPPSSPAP